MPPRQDRRAPWPRAGRVPQAHPHASQYADGERPPGHLDRGRYSGRVTFRAGNAVLDAARKMRELIFAAVAEKLEVPADRLAASWRQVYDVEDRARFVSFEDACVLAESKEGTLGSVGSYK